MRWLLGLLLTATDPGFEAIAPRVHFIPWQSGLSQPLDLQFAPHDPQKRLFIVEKTGRIRVVQNDRLQPKPLLDWSKQVSNGAEQGLLGLAFHPRFGENKRYFINYTDRRGDTRVTEFREGQSQGRDLLLINQPYANHNGGDLAFGPDGRLHIGTGDGGAGFDPHNHAQNPQSRLGKMLVMDVDQPRATPRILQTGLRNPWRYHFDRLTGDLYIADVGQNRFEEVNVVPRSRIGGQNFGWNVVEGINHCVKAPNCRPERFTPPVVEYSHQDGCSITGGIVYRGQAIPQLAGHYFYADFCTGLIKSFRYQNGRVTDHWDWTSRLNPGRHLTNIASFGEDAAGELYLLSLDGTVYKLVPTRQR